MLLLIFLGWFAFSNLFNEMQITKWENIQYQNNQVFDGFSLIVSTYLYSYMPFYFLIKSLLTFMIPGASLDYLAYLFHHYLRYSIFYRVSLLHISQV